MIDSPPTLPPKECAALHALAAADEIGAIPAEIFGEVRWGSLARRGLIQAFVTKSWLDGETRTFVEITDAGMAVALQMRC